MHGDPRDAVLTRGLVNCSALTSLKYEDDRFENVSMEFDEARLAPTYRLLWGIPGRSNALNIAQRLGLDRDVVASARERLGSAQVSGTM
jgi:DNA mismatch repair protein MutS2